MKTPMKVLKKVLGMLAGAALGYGGISLITWMVDGGMSSPESPSGETGYGLWLPLGLAMLWLFVCFFIHLVLHEAGHLIMGLATGFRFLSFRVFNLTLVKTDEGLRWKRFHIAGTGGQCIMDLPESQDLRTAPWFWYNAGGVLMNILLTVAGIVVLRLSNPAVVAYTFFMMLAFVGLFMAITNGVPMMVGGIGNDGHNIRSMWRHPEDRRLFARSFQMAGQMSRGKRMGEMPPEWFEDIPVDGKSRFLEISYRMSYMALLEDRMQPDKAREVAEEVMALGKKLPQLLRLEVGGERVMLELMTSNRREVVEGLWDNQLARYTERNGKYSPMKNAVLYAYELLYKNDEERAKTYKQRLESHEHEYTMPGETRTALAVIDFIGNARLCHRCGGDAGD
jgi:hypothetical protein